MKNQKRLVRNLSLFLSIIGIVFFCDLEPSKAQSVTSDPKVESLRDENFTKLAEAASQTGMVRVIIGVGFDFTPEGYLTNRLKNNQRAEIKQSQDALLNKLETFKPENVRQFESIPYVSMTVNATTLEFLKLSPK